MLKITKLEGYAFLLLTCMASRDSSLLYSAKDLSTDSSLPLPTVSKVLKLLTQAAILKSCQGSRGGYSLAKPADEINVAEIVQIFEGPLALTDCCGEASCPRNCPVAPDWQKLNNAIENLLRGLTLADMVNHQK
ncbi:SUF system Fe-S cluster assembly regulator [Pontiella sulfatireligans]|uniref:HTH-type transcriptional regulator n=1 Tax=Pontiella sulfatireligans TaxID=2750658 RepID=A0A6C2UI73_9BACT|nr:SUF system Fe-S cluster assembly regulator [Pontiella sulfatireligans]VGO19905.1 Putative HTH-type transcriptional regulator [Pontiella sulfatireligans]